MSHFAEVGYDNVVRRVVVAEQDVINSGILGDSFTWVQTSYNGSFRKNYAGVGFSYDNVRGAFIPPKPYNSWALNEDTCRWEAPSEMPEGDYTWDEDTTSWVEITGET